MAVSALFIVFSVVYLKEVNCNPLFEVDDAKSEVKSKLLYLLSFTDLPAVVEEPSVDSDNKNFINAPSYEPSYKSKKNFHDYYDDYKEPKEEYSDKPYDRNRVPLSSIEETYPPSNFNSNEPYKDITTSSENYKEFDKFTEEKKPYIPVYEEYSTSDLDHNCGLKHPGSYQGHYQHQHNHHLHHQHAVGCFPFGHPRPRPRPPRPPPTAVPSIDPRVSTLASIISSKGPGIDIRVGRDTNIQDDVIVFPE